MKSIRSYQMRSFEVMLACVSNDQGEQQLFSSVPVEADRQRQQLNAVLRDLGATPTTPVTVLSDGAEGPRFLGETIRGYASEFGLTAAKGMAHLDPLLERIQADESLPDLARELFAA